MHLVLDTIIAHAVELSIPAAQIAARRAEWNRVLTSRTRAEYVKGLARFCGLELLDYDNCRVQSDAKGNLTVLIHSEYWTMRQPTKAHA